MRSSPNVCSAPSVRRALRAGSRRPKSVQTILSLQSPPGFCCGLRSGDPAPRCEDTAQLPRPAFARAADLLGVRPQTLARFRAPDVDRTHAEVPAECRGEGGGVRVADRLARLLDGPPLVTHQRECVAHPAAQAEIEDRLAEDGLEALGERRLR